MNSERQILTNTILAFVSRGVRMAVLLPLVPFMILHLGEATYGATGVINSVLVLTIMLGLGSRPGATRQFTRLLHAGERGLANELASSATLLYGMLALFTLVVFLSFGKPLLAWMGIPPSMLESTSLALVLAFLGTGLTFLASPYVVALSSQLRHDIRYGIEMVEIVGRGLLIVCLFWFWKADLITWGLAMALPAIAVWWLSRWQARTRCRELSLSLSSVGANGLRQLAGSGLFTSAAQISDWLFVQSGAIVISFVLGPTSVAHYIPAVLIAATLQNISIAFLAQLEPVATRVVVENDAPRLARVWVRSVRYSMLSSGGAAVLLGVLAPSVTLCWLGKGFEDTALVLRLWCATVVVQSLAGGAFALFLGAGTYRYIGTLTALLAIATVALSAVLIGRFDGGIASVAASVLGIQIVKIVLWVRSAAEVCRVPLARWLRETVAPAFCLIMLGLVCQAVANSINNSAWHSLGIASLAGLVAYGLAVWFVGFNAEDRGKVRHYLVRVFRRELG